MIKRTRVPAPERTGQRLAGRRLDALLRGWVLREFVPDHGLDVNEVFRTLVFEEGLLDRGDLAAARAYFEDVGANLIELSLEEHDRRIGYVLGLAHLTSILYSYTLANCDIDFGSLGDVASTTFAKQNATALDVIAENPDLYFEIQSLNAQSPELDRQLRAALDDLLRVVASGDREGFRRIMESGRKFFLG